MVADVAIISEIDRLKDEVTALKNQCASEAAKIDDLKKQMIADKPGGKTHYYQPR